MNDRVCLITGGSRGLGRTMAEAFLEAGAFRVYITARDTSAVEVTAEELTAAHAGDCIALPGDLSSVEEVQHLAA